MKPRRVFAFNENHEFVKTSKKYRKLGFLQSLVYTLFLYFRTYLSLSFAFRVACGVLGYRQQNQCQLSTYSPFVKLTGEAAIQFSIATKKCTKTASYLIRFSSARLCWKHLLLRDTLVLNIRHETTECQMFIVHQR